jgi:hypothetical protein
MLISFNFSESNDFSCLSIDKLPFNALLKVFKHNNKLSFVCDEKKLFCNVRKCDIKYDKVVISLVLTDALSKLVMLFEFEVVVVVDDDFILAFLELNVDLVTIVCIYVYVYICV